MGEFIKSPHADTDGKGASADVGKYLQAAALAAQLGKTVEEVLAFMGTSTPVVVPTQVVEKAATIEVPEESVEEAKELAALMEIAEEPVVEVKPVVKVKAKKEAIPDETGFVVTETVDAADATEAELDEAMPPEEEENDWSGKIREGSKVKIVWQAPGSKIKWEGKKGKVIRVIGNENAKVYEVEFAAGKVAKTRLNKKTGKLERGYITKKFQGTFSEDQVELAD
jgi:hypothetical protein